MLTYPPVDTDADFTLTSNSAEAVADQRDELEGEGDFDGDGLDDLLLSNWRGRGSTGDTNFGEVHVVLATSMSGQQELNAKDGRILGAVAGETLGSRVTAVGDVDGDGRDDFLAAATGYSGGGAAWLFHGPTTGFGTSEKLGAALFLGETSGDSAGTAVTGGADITGDGVIDLGIGASGQDDGGNAAGTLYLLPGGGW